MSKKPCIALLLFIITAPFIFNKAAAQPGLSIVYDISVQKNKTGIEETYNGGTKAIFTNGKKARIRLVSLMRIQSIFLDYNDSLLQKATVIKESGRKKYLFRMSAAEWKTYNKKYDSLTYDTTSADSANINGYPCRKVVITLDNDRQVTAFYTDSIQLNNAVIEPLFRNIKGTVLQYEVNGKKGTVTFKASQINTGNIDPKIFIIPSKGAVVKKYNPKKKVPKDVEVISDEDE